VRDLEFIVYSACVRSARVLVRVVGQRRRRAGACMLYATGAGSTAKLRVRGTARHPRRLRAVLAKQGLSPQPPFEHKRPDALMEPCSQSPESCSSMESCSQCSTLNDVPQSPHLLTGGPRCAANSNSEEAAGLRYKLGTQRRQDRRRLRRALCIISPPYRVDILACQI
jgi:hypothetical protein